LFNILSKVIGFTEKKTTLSVLSHVLLETKDEGLVVKATDLNTSIQVQSKCKVEEQGACAVNCKDLLDVIREMPEGELSLWIEKGIRLHISLSKNKAKLNIMDAQEYPMVDLHVRGTGLSLDPQVIKSMIDKTVFSISMTAESDTKYTLGGAKLSYIEDEISGMPYLEMTTTDSRRLSIIRQGLPEKLDIGEGIILPRKGMQELKKLIEIAEDDSSVIFTKDSLYYQSVDTLATVRLIEGKFPDFRGIQNLDMYTTHVTVNSSELMNALKFCSTMVTDVVNCVKFSFLKDQILLYANNPERGDVEVPISCEHTGEEIEINFNPRFFLDCLAHIQEDAELRLKGAQGPCLITPFGRNDCKWIVMPLRY
jgi:DNA polymerase-3 subunit beta